MPINDIKPPPGSLYYVPNVEFHAERAEAVKGLQEQRLFLLKEISRLNHSHPNYTRFRDDYKAEIAAIDDQIARLCGLGGQYALAGKP
ncbi:MAG TPA: hypothetical protein VHF69_03355 [Candidatus Synoicihabitans sp.]|nr:hypothetical protein [Candidatus Synoicihabitans sp.]